MSNIDSSTIFKLIWISKHFFGNSLTNILLAPLVSLQKKRVNAILNNSVTIKNHTQIEIITQISPEEFHQKYLATNTPVIIKNGAKDWPAVGKWNLDFFATTFPNEEQPKIATSGDKIYEAKKNKEKLEFYKLSELKNENVTDKEKFYGNFSPLVHKYPELKKDLKLDWLRKLQNKYSSLMMYQLFMGAKGHKTDLHSEISSNLFIMLSGKKKWAMCSPKYNEFLEVAVSREPCFHSPVNFFEKSHAKLNELVNYFEFTLDEGDILFVPPYYWHQVVNETQSVGLAIKWHNPASYMKSSITQSILTTFCVNPPIWKLVGKGNYLKLFTDGRE